MSLTHVSCDYIEVASDTKEFLKNLKFYFGGSVEIDLNSLIVSGPEGMNEKNVHEIYKMTRSLNSSLKKEVGVFDCGAECFCTGYADPNQISLPTGCTINSEDRDENIRNLGVLFKKMAKKFFDTAHVAVPNIISKDVLVKTGYFEKFPNQAIIGSVMRLDPEIALTFNGKDFTAFDHQAYALNPVTCYHIYSNYKLLNEKYKNNSFTLTGKAHRFEGLNIEHGRKNEFDIVEIVFFETDIGVELDKIIAFYNDFFDLLGMSVRYVTSSDSFFSKDADLRSKLQLRTSSKIEIEAEGSVLSNNVIASINTHADFFVDRFNLDKLGVQSTKCTGFGVERLLDHLEGLYQNATYNRINDAISHCN